MELKQLYYFQQVYIDGSFSRSAKRLYITQQGISRTIHQLEEELGVVLFERVPSGVVPTPAGAYLKERCDFLLAYLVETGQHIKQFGPMTTTVLRLGIAAGIRLLLTPDVFDAFAAAHPQLDITYSERRDLGCEEEVEAGITDLAIAIAPVDTDKFHCLPLLSQPVCVLVNQAHPLAAKKQIHLEALLQEPVILTGQENKGYHIYLDFCRSHRILPEIAYQVPDMLSVYALCRAGKGIGFSLPNIHNHLPNDGTQCIPIVGDENPTWDVCLISKKGQAITAPMAEFTAYIKAYCDGLTLL